VADGAGKLGGDAGHQAAQAPDPLGGKRSTGPHTEIDPKGRVVASSTAAATLAAPLWRSPLVAA
jgi:hypothetical protein